MNYREIYKNHLIQTATQTGGKAGRGRNATSSIQVRTQDGCRVLKTIRYRVGDNFSQERAREKARDWIDTVTGV